MDFNVINMDYCTKRKQYEILQKSHDSKMKLNNILNIAAAWRWPQEYIVKCCMESIVIQYMNSAPRTSLGVISREKYRFSAARKWTIAGAGWGNARHRQVRECHQPSGTAASFLVLVIGWSRNMACSQQPRRNSALRMRGTAFYPSETGTVVSRSRREIHEAITRPRSQSSGQSAKLRKDMANSCGEVVLLFVRIEKRPVG